MKFNRTFQTVETHHGLPMRVVTSGVPTIPGDSVYKQTRWLEKNDDQIRKLMLREPRGYPAACCNLIVPAKHPDAVAGYIIMEQIEYPMMSGGNTIAVATALLETGMIPMQEPVTEFNLEAPAGLIGIRADCAAMPAHGRELTRISALILRAAQDQLQVEHPSYPGVGITLGTVFNGHLIDEVEIAGRAGVVPTIGGEAWIYGFGTYVRDPTDPFPNGFTVGDLWA